MSCAVPAVYYRGGSSKAVFFHERDIPAPGDVRDRFLKRVIGSPDPIQIDGMGGSRVITSKIAIVKVSDRPDADVDYTFAQAGITEDLIGYTGNCGNISSAVGPFAVSEGLVKDVRPGVSLVDGLKTQEIRIFNTGTQKVLNAHVPIDQDGNVIEAGDFSIAAVPGSGAPILMDYSKTIGAAHGRGILPTANATDEIDFRGGKIPLTICDVGNLTVFVKAQDVGLRGSESAEEISNDKTAITGLAEVRGKAAHLLGRCTSWEVADAESPMLPMAVIVAPDPSGDGHLLARLILDNRCHDSMAGTGAICMAACSRVTGSVVHQILASSAISESTFRIHHPLGVMPVAVMVNEDRPADAEVEFRTLSFIRTARRIMTGHVHVPSEFMPPTSLSKPSAKLDSSLPASTLPSDDDITGKVCTFIASTKYEDCPPEIFSKLSDFIIDHIGVASSAALRGESSDALLQAVQALGGNTGQSTVYAKGKTFTPQYAAFLNGAFAHTFDFDDTMAEAVLHPGASIIPAALAEAERSGSSGKQLLVALAVGYEVACRLGCALGTGGYARGFHNTSTAGIFGAVAALANLRGLSPSTVENAFGIAGSRASGSMQFLHNGAWNKRLHPGFAAHDALVCVALAEAGVAGASPSIEGKWGFLHSFSESSNPAGICAGLGSSWIFLATALKPFPACRMTHAAIEIAARTAAQEAPGVMPEKISVRLSPACYNIVGEPSPNKRHPKTIVDAQFSIYYQIAASWIFGCEIGWDVYSDQAMADPRIAELCTRITVAADGEVEELEARIDFEGLQEGPRQVVLVHPLGEPENPYSRERVRSKFLGLTKDVYAGSIPQDILATVDGLAEKQVGDLAKLL